METERLEEMAAFFERRLGYYDSHMLEDIECAKEFYEFTARQLPKGACRVLDLGCGTGLELEAYFKRNPMASVAGIDLSAKMLGELRRKFPDKDLELIHGSYFEVPFGEDRFDAAVSVESLHHFAYPEKLGLYRRLFAAIKPGEYFVLTDYFAESPEREKFYFEELARMKREQNLPEGSYHYDTPLTLEHETEVLIEAGFSEVQRLNGWEANHTIIARKKP